MSFTDLTRQFEDWTRQSGIQVSPKIEIRDLRAECQGRGIVAVDDIEEDEILFSIPRNVLLNIDTGSLSAVSSGNREKLLTKYDHWEGLILTIFYELSLGHSSKWWPYFSILPTEFHSLMFWNDEELEELKPSLVLDRIGKDKAEELYNKLIPGALADLGIEHLASDISIDKFHKIASFIMSYSFDVERPDFIEDLEDDEQVKYDGYFKSMVALADLLNADTSLCNANLIYEAEYLIMKSIAKIRKGEQVYNTYGDHPNSELLRRYGYVEWNGSKFDFGELPLSIIESTLLAHYDVKPDFMNKLVDIISTTEVEEIEENLILDSYDVYNDGEVIPELTILLQSLVIILEINNLEHWDEIKSVDVLTKNVNRCLKKCYQLVENSTITKKFNLIWDQCISNRLNEYPSHAFRNFIQPKESERLNKIKMSECILKSEVCSLQKGLLNYSNNFKTIDDEKMIRNILKRKLTSSENDSNANDKKRQKI